MKRTILFAAIVAMAAASLWTPAATAEEHEQKFKVTGEIRSRFEYLENAADFAEPENGGIDDNFSFWPYRVRLGIDGQVTENIRAVVDVQNFGNFGNVPPNKGFDIANYIDFFDYTLPGPGGNPLPFLPLAHMQSLPSAAGEDDINLYQAFIDVQKIGGSNLDLRIGRQEKTYGTELLLGDNDFYAGLSFDGLNLTWGGERVDVHGFYFKTAENNYFGGPFFNIWQVGADFLIDGGSLDQNLFGVIGDFEINETLGNVGVYYIGYKDHFVNAGLDTFGARWGVMPSQERMFDWNLEVAAQTGEVAAEDPAFDLSGEIVEGWFGFSVGENLRHRFHVGGLLASGDDPNTPNENEAFTPLFGDTHAYGRLGYLDLFNPTNITDFNLGYTLGLAEGRHQLGLAYHMFTLTEELGGEDDLGDEIDAWWNWNLNKNFGVQAGIAQFAVGDAFGPNSDDVLRGWAQARVTW